MRGAARKGRGMFGFARRRALRRRAERIYSEIVAQARSPAFYARLGAPDDLDGRFDLILLHAYVVLRRLRAEDGDSPLSQAVFDAMFADMDRSLREMGVGDLSVPKRIKEMGRAAFGRFAAYDAAMEEGETAFAAALRRNVYGGAPTPPSAESLAALTAYALASVAAADAAAAPDGQTRPAVFAPAPEQGGAP